jgi:putative RNA 2'-phosphotransferase
MTLMRDAQRKRASKYLSLHLRHQPERLGLTLAEGGWVGVEELLAACAAHGFPISRADLDEIVRRCDKQRFSLDEGRGRIRANQGHSVPVDLQLAPREPPARLYHGTPASAADQVAREGLRKMSRHHVHLSVDVPTAERVGARRGKPVIFEVDAAGMHAAGLVFYCSDNGVWLTDQVPPGYLRRR